MLNFFERDADPPDDAAAMSVPNCSAADGSAGTQPGGFADAHCSPADSPDEPTGQGWLPHLRVVSLLTLFSRLLGLMRDVLMAAVFGNGALMDAFSVAFRVPNLARRLFGEGALSTTFLPLFLQECDKRGEDSAWRLAGTVVASLAGLLLSVTLFGELVLWSVSLWGDAGTEGQRLLFLTALLLPYLVLICLAAQFSALLHARGQFAVPALLPVMLNVVWIAALVGIVPLFETPVEKMTVVCVGILLGGVLQLTAPLPALWRRGFRLQTDWAEHKSGVRHLGRTVLPVLLGLSITQINTLADSLIAWGVSRPEGAPAEAMLFGTVGYPMHAGTASALYFAQRVYQFPLGVFGIALGTVLFPLFARQAQAGQTARLRGSLELGLRLVTAIGIPAAAGLMLLCTPLTRLCFQYGAFDARDVQQTAKMIAVYGAAVWAYCGLMIVQRGFFALGDRQTPLRVGLLAVGLNLALDGILIWPLGGNGLALATSLTAVLQFLLLAWLLQAHVERFDAGSISRTVAKTLAATGIMAIACVMTLSLFAESARVAGRLWRVVVPVAASLAVFGVAAKLLGLHEPWLLWRRSGDADGDVS